MMMTNMNHTPIKCVILRLYKCQYVKEDLIGKSDVSSHLFEVDQDDKVADFFADVFGLHDILLDSIYKIDEEEAKGLYQYFVDLKYNDIIDIQLLKNNL